MHPNYRRPMGAMTKEAVSLAYIGGRTPSNPTVIPKAISGAADYGSVAAVLVAVALNSGTVFDLIDGYAPSEPLSNVSATRFQVKEMFFAGNVDRQDTHTHGGEDGEGERPTGFIRDCSSWAMPDPANTHPLTFAEHRVKHLPSNSS